MPQLANITAATCLQNVDAEVYRHLSRLGPSALDLAFPWILSAFVGHLSPAETLLLWDRIIGFDSLLPLPVLGAAVMTFRCANNLRLLFGNRCCPARIGVILRAVGLLKWSE
jgi:hypothetical protein